MKIAICAIIKNENEYLSEWINYHKKIGIDHFFLYDNQSDYSVMSYLSEFLNDFIQDKSISVNIWKDNEVGSQMRAYKNCCKNNQNYDYISFIDIDEFIVINKKFNSLQELLFDYKEFSGLCISWRMYGKPKPYFECRKPMNDYIHYFENSHVKTIVSPKDVINFPDPHLPLVKKQCVNEDKEIVKTPNSKHLSKDIWIKHIWTRSENEFKEKIKRGSGDKVSRIYRMSDFYEHNDKCILNDKKGCIIIPFRNREEHLKDFLSQVKVDLDIFVIEQMGDELFNRGQLLNIGFDLNKNNYDYFIFHDVDMIPFKNIDYSYSKEITHLATKTEQYKYEMPYPTYLGGVTLFPKDRFILINGFSNNYWGWGQEDDNLYFRCIHKNLKIENRDIWFKSLQHKNNYLENIYLKNTKISEDFQNNPEKIDIDGLNSLSYEELSIEKKNKYNLIKVKLWKTEEH